jgi:hypothetical protein
VAASSRGERAAASHRTPKRAGDCGLAPLWSAGACSRFESLGRIALALPLGTRRIIASPFFLQDPAITSAILKETTRNREIIAVPFPKGIVNGFSAHRLTADTADTAIEGRQGGQQKADGDNRLDDDPARVPGERRTKITRTFDAARQFEARVKRTHDRETYPEGPIILEHSLSQNRPAQIDQGINDCGR